MDPLHGWLKKAGQKGIHNNAFKKKYFRQHGAELHYYENDKADESQGFINLSDCINLFPEGKPKQGIFIVLTQSRAWKLQAVGDDPDHIRAQWMRSLENWLIENRPGFKKLKKMGFDKPTQVQGVLPSLQKRVSQNGPLVPMQESPRTPEKVVTAPPPSAVDEEAAALIQEYGLATMKASALNYRRLELQIKIAEASLSDGTENAALLKRVKELEEEREERRSAAAMREFQVSEIEREYAAVANDSRADFQQLLERVSDFQVKLLKPGFETVQNVFSCVQEGDVPSVSKEETFELLSHFDAILPPVENALHMSTTLLQKDRLAVLNRVTELEGEIKSLHETIDELDEKKQQMEESVDHLRAMSSQIQMVAKNFPIVSLDKEEAVKWLTSGHDAASQDPLETALGQTKDLMEGQETDSGNANLKLMRMEKIGAASPNIVLNEDGSIKMATVDGMFSLLINGEGRIKHPEFESAILYGFPSFAQPMDLLEKIVLCFCSTLPSNFNGSRQRSEAIIEMNRKRLLNIIQRWMLFHEDHFRERNFGRFFQDFIVTVELSGLKEEAEQLRSRMSSVSFPYAGEFEKPVVPPDLSNFQLLDLAPLEVARQMTRLDSALFEVVETRDFLETAWTSKNPNVATSVKAITKHFNRMSQWIASMILQEEDLRRRAGTIEFFILVAESCLQLNNFNGLLQCIGALSKTEVHRLTNSWELVGKEKTKLMEAHRELLQSNCSLLRQRYAQAKPPCLPYMGTYLTDLVMIGEQKTRFGDKVNYRKLQLQEKCLSALVRRTEEGIKFPFREVKEIRDLIMDDSRLFATDNDLMKRSQELEPRAAEGGTAKIAKTKSVSALMRNESRAKVQRKGATERPSSVMSSPSGLGTRPMTQTVGRSQTQAPPMVPASDRVPPPSTSPGAPPPGGGTSFRTLRAGMRASSPAGQISALRESSPLSGSPMIGKRAAMRSPTPGSVESTSPSDSGANSPKGRPVPAPRSPASARRESPTTPIGGRRTKALPVPPSDDEDDEEEESDDQEIVVRQRDSK